MIESFNPLHLTRGVWHDRVLADRPMGNSPANYGISGIFKRPYDGVRNIAIHEAQYEGNGNTVTELQNYPNADGHTINDSTGGGTTQILARVDDPAGSGRKVWQMQADYSKLWSLGASDALGGDGRRRNELRTTASTSYMIPYGAEVWDIRSIYLDPAVNWAGMTAGDYAIVHQMHDTSQGSGNGAGFNNPSFAAYIAAGGSDRAGDWSDPCAKWHMIYQVRQRQNLPESVQARWYRPNPPVGKWIYTVLNYVYNGATPFIKIWHVEEGKAPILAIEIAGPWGIPDDVAVDYATAGMYSPGLYLGTVPYRRFYQDGVARILASDVPGMTPERMVACLRDQQIY
ncbi:hypothetical protein [Methylophilus sp.]|uniref:hypothetical protein n=1 Tax=Methylophilus sp. TaxID=29541 RepID=UPI000D4D2B7A|nr:hypothetical protein [Methylophilus sp.]PPD12159.1 MAG: hypothetical protein CTY26_06095 [Methylophilus sp.]